MLYRLTFPSLIPALPSVVFEDIYVGPSPLNSFPVLKLKLEFCYSPFYTTTFPFLIFFKKGITVETTLIKEGMCLLYKVTPFRFPKYDGSGRYKDMTI